MNPLPYELAKAKIADLNRQAEPGQIACCARQARRASHRHAATAHRSTVLPRLRALLTGRTSQSAS